MPRLFFPGPWSLHIGSIGMALRLALGMVRPMMGENSSQYRKPTSHPDDPTASPEKFGGEQQQSQGNHHHGRSGKHRHGEARRQDRSAHQEHTELPQPPRPSSPVVDETLKPRPVEFGKSHRSDPRLQRDPAPVASRSGSYPVKPVCPSPVRTGTRTADTPDRRRTTPPSRS